MWTVFRYACELIKLTQCDWLLIFAMVSNIAYCQTTGKRLGGPLIAAVFPNSTTIFVLMKCCFDPDGINPRASAASAEADCCLGLELVVATQIRSQRIPGKRRRRLLITLTWP